jgi:hypothetical protein
LIRLARRTILMIKIETLNECLISVFDKPRRSYYTCEQVEDHKNECLIKLTVGSSTMVIVESCRVICRTWMLSLARLFLDQASVSDICELLHFTRLILQLRRLFYVASSATDDDSRISKGYHGGSYRQRA